VFLDFDLVDISALKRDFPEAEGDLGGIEPIAYRVCDGHEIEGSGNEK
jgi:hypothetical protein